MTLRCLDAAKYTSYSGLGSLQPKNGLQVSIVPRLRNPGLEAAIPFTFFPHSCPPRPFPSHIDVCGSFSTFPARPGTSHFPRKFFPFNSK